MTLAFYFSIPPGGLGAIYFPIPPDRVGWSLFTPLLPRWGGVKPIYSPIPRWGRWSLFTPLSPRWGEPYLLPYPPGGVSQAYLLPYSPGGVGEAYLLPYPPGGLGEGGHQGHPGHPQPRHHPQLSGARHPLGPKHVAAAHQVGALMVLRGLRRRGGCASGSKNNTENVPLNHLFSHKQ